MLRLTNFPQIYIFKQMSEESKSLSSINFLVLSTALWVFTSLFSISCFVFILIVDLLKINTFVKSINEYVSALILGVLVFGVFTGCIMLAEKFLNLFFPKQMQNKGMVSLVLSVLFFVISIVGMYYFLASMLVFVENKI